MVSRRKRICIKRRYENKNQALDAAYIYVSTFGARRMNAYQCEVCRAPGGRRYWHIGHPGRRWR